MKEAIETAKELVRRLVSNYVFDEKSIEVTSNSHGVLHLVKLRVHGGDMGRAVGPKGAHIRALSWIIESFGQQKGLNIELNLEEPTQGGTRVNGRLGRAAAWNHAGIVELLRDVNKATLGQDFHIEEVTDGDITVLNVRAGAAMRINRLGDYHANVAALFNIIGRAHGKILKVVVE